MEGPSKQAVIDPKQEVPDGGETVVGEESTVTPSVLDSEDYLCAQKCVFCQCIMTPKDRSKLLECLHPACDSCLRTPTNTSDIDLGEARYLSKLCPVCSHPSHHEKLIDNKFLVEITALQVNVETKCKNCADQIANDWCNECTNYICEACVTEHRSSRLCKHHTIISKDEMFLKKDSNPVIDSYFKCSIHPKEVQEVYCNTCGEILCRDCTLVNHKGHSYAYVNEIATATRAELTSLITKLRYKTDMARDGMRQIELKNKAIQDKKIELHNSVKDTVKELICIVKRMAENLLKEIDSECDKRRHMNNSRADALNQAYAQGSYSTDFVVQALEMATDKCLAYSRQRIVDHVNRQLTAKNVSFPSPDYPITMHLKKNSVEKLRQVLGHFVKFETTDPGAQPYMVHVPPQMAGQQTFYQHSQQYQQQQQQQQQHLQKQQQQLWYQQQAQQQALGPPGGVSPASVYSQQQYHSSVVHHQPSSVLVSQQPHVNVIQGSASGPLRSPQQQVSSSTDQQATSPLHARTLPQHQSMGYGGLGNAAAKPPHHQQFYQHQSQQQQYYHQTQQVAPNSAPNLKTLLTAQQQPATLHHQQSMNRMGMVGQGVGRSPVVGANTRLIQGGLGASGSGSGVPLPSHQQQQQAAVNRLHQQQQQQVASQQQQQQMPLATAANAAVSSTPTWHIPQLEPSTSCGGGGSRHPFQGQHGVGGGGATAGANAMSAGGLGPSTATQDNFKIHLPSRTDPPKPLATARVTPSPSQLSAPAPIAEELDFSSAGVLDLLQNLATDELSGGGASTVNLSSSSGSSVVAGGKDSSSVVAVAVATKDTSQGDKTVTSTAATPPASAPVATPPVTEQPASSTQQEGVVEWQKDDPNEDWCAVCMDGGDLVCCDSCPKVFHTTCHIPQLAQTPPQDEPWQCLLCRTLPCLSGIGDKKSQDLTVTQHTILERILLELYCQYDQSLHFREPVPIDNKDYHSIIKKPMSFDMIRRRLAPDSYNPYKSVRQVIRHIRQVFKNAFLFNEVGSQVFKDAINLEEFLECLLTKYLPDFAHTDLSDSSSEDEDEPQVKRFRRIIGGVET